MVADTSEKNGVMANDKYVTKESIVANSSIEEGRVNVDTKGDAALQYVSLQAIEIDPETNSHILRKIDFHLLPWMFGLYALQYLDKTALSYAAIMGIKDDTHINNSQYSWTGSIFYLGYLAFEYPHNVLMQKFPLAKYISITVIFWGLVLCCHAGTSSFAGLMVTRFFLGALEGSVTAGFVLITSRWYRGSEQAFRTAIWFCANGFAQIVGGALAYGIARGFSENSSITYPPWKAIFLLCGLMTGLYGFGLLYFLPDSPIDARWLSQEERKLAVERLRENQQGIGTRVFKWYQFREAFTDIRTYVIFLFCVTSTIPCGGITVFFTQLIQGYGFSSEDTLLISMPGGVVQIIVNLLFPYIAYRTQNRMASASGAMLLSLFGTALMAGLARNGANDYRIGQLVGYYIVIGNSATALILILSSVGTNVAGYTKKTTVNAITLIGYCIGFLIGPQTFRDGPHYNIAKYDILAQWTASLVCCLILLWINHRENTRRKKVAANLPPQPPGQEFLDLTDKENPYFRYSL